MRDKREGDYGFIDYLHKLTPKDKAFIRKFALEAHYGKGLHPRFNPLHSTPDQAKACRDASNARRRDIMNVFERVESSDGLSTEDEQISRVVMESPYASLGLSLDQRIELIDCDLDVIEIRRALKFTKGSKDPGLVPWTQWLVRELRAFRKRKREEEQATSRIVSSLRASRTTPMRDIPVLRLVRAQKKMPSK